MFAPRSDCGSLQSALNMTSNEIRSALQLSALLAENAARPLDSGLTPDQAIADLEAALDASLKGAAPEVAPALSA